MHYKEENQHVLGLIALIDHAEEIKELMGFDTRYNDRPYDPYYLIRVADLWSRDLDFWL